MSLHQRFSVNLRRCRKRAGLTQADLAFRVEIHPTAISFMESGKRMPRMDTLVKLTGALDCRADELTEGMRWRPKGGDFYGSYEIDDG
jgi:transcriptional regulator with XRE-family HTH domain